MVSNPVSFLSLSYLTIVHGRKTSTTCWCLCPLLSSTFDKHPNDVSQSFHLLLNCVVRSLSLLFHTFLLTMLSVGYKLPLSAMISLRLPHLHRISSNIQFVIVLAFSSLTGLASIHGVKLQ